MIRAKGMVLASTVLLFLGLPPSQAQPDPNAKAAELFQVQWEVVDYNKQVRVVNGQDSATRREAWESLSLRCRVQTRDPNLVLGICERGSVTQLTDSQGRDVSLPVPPSQRRPPQYTRLQWREVQLSPPQEPRWRALIRSFLRLKRGPSLPPQTGREPMPIAVSANVGMGLLRQGDKEIGSVKGYFPALVADAIEYIQVPFKSSEHWVPLPDGKAFRVNEASCDKTSYRYEIGSRSSETSRKLDGLWLVGPLLPSRVVISTQFLAADGKPVPSSNYWWTPNGIGGSGSGNLTNGPIKTIRFVIAVNPTHRRIPFELQHIPLPDPQQTATDSASSR